MTQGKDGFPNPFARQQNRADIVQKKGGERRLGLTAQCLAQKMQAFLQPANAEICDGKVKAGKIRRFSFDKGQGFFKHGNGLVIAPESQHPPRPA